MADCRPCLGRAYLAYYILHINLLSPALFTDNVLACLPVHNRERQATKLIIAGPPGELYLSDQCWARLSDIASLPPACYIGQESLRPISPSIHLYFRISSLMR